jgi:Flp pilus assembly pilin Flp
VAIFQLLIARLLTGSSLDLLPARVRSHRGATFIEYLLLAAIAVVLFGVIGFALRGAFDGILQSIRDALSI